MFDAVCFVYTCRRLIDLFLIAGTVTGEAVSELLISLKLGQYAEVMEAAGYCFVQDLSGADDAELDGLAKECGE